MPVSNFCLLGLCHWCKKLASFQDWFGQEKAGKEEKRKEMK
jgi:hypothetical protein